MQRELRGEPISETYAVRFTPTTRRLIDAEARRLGLRPVDITRMAVAYGLEVMRRARETADQVAGAEKAAA